MSEYDGLRVCPVCGDREYQHAEGVNTCDSWECRSTYRGWLRELENLLRTDKIFAEKYAERKEMMQQLINATGGNPESFNEALHYAKLADDYFQWYCDEKGIYAYLRNL